MTTNLTARSAQADTITAAPPRTVPRGTQRGWFVRLIPLALMAVLSIPMAQAQLIYTYNGNDFTNIYSTALYGTKITVTLTVLAPIPPNLNNSGGQCGTASITDRVIAFPPTACSLTTDSTGTITGWDIEYVPGGCNCPGVRQMDTLNILNIPGFASARDISFRNGVGGNTILNDPGTWTYPTAFSLTNALLGKVDAMNIPKQGTSLIDQLTTVLTDINNGTLGLACSDLQIFANHVKAQTGKGITTAQATTIMQYVAAISAGIPGCQVH
jgi:hypothetical protein